MQSLPSMRSAISSARFSLSLSFCLLEKCLSDSLSQGDLNTMSKEQEEQQDVRSRTTPESAKRKLEDPILLAKQKAQEIAARLVSNAESKRPRLDNESSELSPTSNPVYQPTFPGKPFQPSILNF